MKTRILLFFMCLMTTVWSWGGEAGARPPVLLSVASPATGREFPEPLPVGQAPGFKWRGTKGWAWTPEQYQSEIPWIAKFKMNFLMNCYLSMFDLEHYPQWDSRDANRWWEDLPPAKQRAYEKVVKSAQEHGLEFCFSMNPNLFSRRTVNEESATNLDLLFKHYAWMQGLGVKWFNLSLDDATNGVNPRTQSWVCNEVFHRLRLRDPAAQMIFCPTYYWGDGTRPKQSAYLSELARSLDPDIYVFWTGDAVVGPVTRRAAEKFRGLVQHRLFLWDNYPVNDSHPTMHLGPVTGRDADLGEVIDGYMCNPMRAQNEINRIPLATCADYAWNPRAYDPAVSIGRAIRLQAETPTQQEVLGELVATYPGMLSTSQSAHRTSFNPVRQQAMAWAARHESPVTARKYEQSFEDLISRFNQAFPHRYAAEKDTLAHDLTFVKQHLPTVPLTSPTF
jgi:beta-N-acetylglucosaminidase